jgi:hypothetical protein
VHYLDGLETHDNKAMAMPKALISSYATWADLEFLPDIQSLRLRCWRVLRKCRYVGTPCYQLVLEVPTKTSTLMKRHTFALSQQMEWITEFVYRSGLKKFHSNKNLCSEKGLQINVLCGFGIHVAEWMPKANGVGVTVSEYAGAGAGAGHTSPSLIRLEARSADTVSGRLWKMYDVKGLQG